MSDEKAPTLDQLKAQMRVASDNGNDGDVVKIAKAMQKLASDVTKSEAEKAKKEGEALAGDREKLAVEIWKGISNEVKAKLAKVKARGFTFKLDEDDVQYKAVSLTVPTVKKSGGGGSGTGVTIQSQTGLRRSELVDKYATDKEKAEIAKAQEGVTNPGSAKWAAEKPVVKRILADNPHLIKR